MPITVVPVRHSIKIRFAVDEGVVVGSPTVTAVIKEADDRDTIVVSGLELDEVSGSDPAEWVGYVDRDAIVGDGEDPDDYIGNEYWVEVDYDDGPQSSGLFTDKFVLRWG